MTTAYWATKSVAYAFAVGCLSTVAVGLGRGVPLTMAVIMAIHLLGISADSLSRRRGQG